MPLRKNELTNILFKQNIELVTYLLKAIGEDYNIQYEELERKYIKPFKTTKKRNTNKKGKMTCYSMFLADKSVDEDLKKRYPDMSFGALSKEKGKVWKAMSNIDKDKYRLKAQEYNKNLANEEQSEEVEEIVEEDN